MELCPSSPGLVHVTEKFGKLAGCLNVKGLEKCWKLHDRTCYKMIALHNVSGLLFSWVLNPLTYPGNQLCRSIWLCSQEPPWFCHRIAADSSLPVRSTYIEASIGRWWSSFPGVVYSVLLQSPCLGIKRVTGNAKEYLRSSWSAVTMLHCTVSTKQREKFEPVGRESQGSCGFWQYSLS